MVEDLSVIEGEYLRDILCQPKALEDTLAALETPQPHAILTSPKEKNRIQGIKKIMDRRTCGARRRQEALVKSTDLIVPMVKRALNLSIPAKYLLMDSWFGFPALVRSVMEHIHVICMVKNTSKVFYELEGKSLTLSKIYRMIRKRPGRS